MENHKFYNCNVDFDDGSNYLLDANWLHNNNMDFWKDWYCNAGSDRLYIAPDSSVYGGECMNDYLGNLNTEWSILLESTRCKRDRCSGCTDDLITKKHKP